jgi:uncharacterized protein involved in tellurium resistance
LSTKNKYNDGEQLSRDGHKHRLFLIVFGMVFFGETAIHKKDGVITLQLPLWVLLNNDWRTIAPEK